VVFVLEGGEKGWENFHDALDIGVATPQSEQHPLQDKVVQGESLNLVGGDELDDVGCGLQHPLILQGQHLFHQVDVDKVVQVGDQVILLGLTDVLVHPGLFLVPVELLRGEDFQ
jgi:hypothetical protein